MATKGKVKAMTVVSTMALAGVLVAGCGQSGTTNQAATSTASGPVQFTIMAPFFNAQPPQMDGNPVFQKLQDLTNSKLTVNWVPNAGNVYNDKVNVALASGTLPQVFVATNPKSSAIVNAARSGMFWDLSPYLKDYPNIQKWLNPIAFQNSSIDGKAYGLYLARPIARVGILVRQDLLDKLGLQAPKTPDDVYKVAKALTQNGMYGIGMQYNTNLSDRFWNGLASLTVANGGPNQWGLVNGKVTPDFMTPEGLSALKEYRTMYQEKILDPDFSTPGFDVAKAFYTGKVAMIIQTFDNITTADTELKKVDPNEKITIVASLQGPKGPVNPATPGYNGEFMFPKSTVKTEQQLKDILGYYDKALDQKVVDLLSLGIEGQSYKVDNGVTTITDQQYINNNVNPFTELVVRPAISTTPGVSAVSLYNRQEQQNNIKYAIPNLADSLISQTAVDQGPQLDKTMMDAEVKYIMGAIDDAGFQSAINTWLQQGGQKEINEYTQAYNQTNKK